jgi:hypothetical protein
MDVKSFITEIENFGFEKVLEIPFAGYESYKEHFYVYFHRKYGIVLQFDTYSNADLNGGYYYYQWRASKEWVIDEEKRSIERGGIGHVGYHPCLSSGGYVGDKHIPREIYDMVWHGHGDCRSHMISNIKQLATDGMFITPWIESDGIMSPTFVHYGDHQTSSGAPWDVGYKLYVNAVKVQTPKRFNMLSELVQTAICKGMREERMEIKKE